MRIDILIPVKVDIRNEEIMKKALQCKAPDTEIIVTSLKEGIESIECDYDVAIAVAPTVAMATELEKRGSEAVIIYCFAEPALEAVKEKLNIPVIGIREASMALASIMGNKKGIIAPIANTVPSFERGIRDRSVRIVSMDLPVLDYLDYEKVEESIDTKTRYLVENGCDVVVLGCGSILGIDIKGIQKKYNVPIVEPIEAAISVAEYMIRNRLHQSKIFYPNPPQK